MNLYRYVGNGPTNATDPTGLQSVSDKINPGDPTKGVRERIEQQIKRRVKVILTKKRDDAQEQLNEAEERQKKLLSKKALSAAERDELKKLKVTIQKLKDDVDDAGTALEDMENKENSEGRRAQEGTDIVVFPRKPEPFIPDVRWFTGQYWGGYRPPGAGIDRDGKPSRGGIMLGSTATVNLGGCLGFPENAPNLSFLKRAANNTNIFVDTSVVVPWMGRPEGQIGISIDFKPWP